MINCLNCIHETDCQYKFMKVSNCPLFELKGQKLKDKNLAEKFLSKIKGGLLNVKT